MSEEQSAEESVKEILARDHYSRVNLKWPLVKFGDISIDSSIDFKHSTLSFLETNERRRPMSMNFSINPIFEIYPSLVSIFDKHRGNLCIAGGIFTSIMRGIEPNDVDIFFIGCTVDEADIILADCVATIISEADEYYPNNNHRIRVDRQMHVTTVTVFVLENDGYSRDREYKYQFIHRIYPRFDLVIGGFDIGPSMIGYDGFDIYCTELGAYSINHDLIIADVKRRSPSFAHRLIKYYKRGFSIILPGLKKSVITHMNRQEYNDRVNQVYQLLKELGLRTNSFISPYSYERQEPIVQDSINIVLKDIRIKSYEFDLKLIEVPNPEKSTDYSNFDFGSGSYMQRYVNGISLRTDRFENIIISKEIPEPELIPEKRYTGKHLNVNSLYLKSLNISYEEAHDMFIQMRDSPVIEYDNLSFKSHFKETLRVACTYKWYKMPYSQKHNTFGQHLNDIIGLTNNFHEYTNLKDPIFDLVSDKLLEYMASNLPEARKYITGVKWMTENPQRQWTSSFHPIMKDVKDFYKKNYNGFYIGIPPEVETQLRLFRLKSSSFDGFRKLPKEIFNKILGELFLIWNRNSYKESDESDLYECLNQAKAI